MLCAGVVSTNFSKLNIVKLISEVTGNLRKSAKTLKGFAHPSSLFSAYSPTTPSETDTETERARERESARVCDREGARHSSSHAYTSIFQQNECTFDNTHLQCHVRAGGRGSG